MNGFQANVAPSEAAGLPAACLAKRLASRWHGCGLRRQVPCRRRLHNPQRPQGGRTRECVELPRLAQAADAVYLIRGAGFTRARRALCLPGRGLRRQVPCRRRLHNPQRPQEPLASLIFFQSVELPRRQDCPNTHGTSARRCCLQASRRTERVRRCACVGVTCAHASPRDQRGSLCSAHKNIHKAPCTWRTPPPSRAGPPYYPYAKVISSARKDLQGSLCLACTPPQPGQVPTITRMQKLSAVQEATYKKSFCAACTPPPAGAGPRYYPYAKVINSAQTDPHMEKVYGLG